MGDERTPEEQELADAVDEIVAGKIIVGPGRIVQLTDEELAKVNAEWDRGDAVRLDEFVLGERHEDEWYAGTTMGESYQPPGIPEAVRPLLRAAGAGTGRPPTPVQQGQTTAYSTRLREALHPTSTGRCTWFEAKNLEVTPRWSTAPRWSRDNTLIRKDEGGH